jgi:hypothetical protein
VGVRQIVSLQNVIKFAVEIADGAMISWHFPAVVPQVGVHGRFELVGFFAIGTNVQADGVHFYGLMK